MNDIPIRPLTSFAIVPVRGGVPTAEELAIVDAAHDADDRCENCNDILKDGGILVDTLPDATVVREIDQARLCSWECVAEYALCIAEDTDDTTIQAMRGWVWLDAVGSVMTP